MAEIPQTYENHTRRHTPFHFFLLPLLLLNFILALVQLIRFRDVDHAWWFALSPGLLVLAFLVRIYALRVQDRVIRLEERLRYQQVLAPALVERTGALTIRQVVALRFASDDELADLVQQVLDGKLTEGRAIKRAVKHWRPDTFRV